MDPPSEPGWPPLGKILRPPLKIPAHAPGNPITTFSLSVIFIIPMHFEGIFFPYPIFAEKSSMAPVVSARSLSEFQVLQAPYFQLSSFSW